MRAILLAALLMTSTVLVATPSASAACGGVSVDEAQGCANYTIDLAQLVGGWAVHEACSIAMGEENCD